MTEPDIGSVESRTVNARTVNCIRVHSIMFARTLHLARCISIMLHLAKCLFINSRAVGYQFKGESLGAVTVGFKG